MNASSPTVPAHRFALHCRKSPIPTRCQRDPAWITGTWCIPPDSKRPIRHANLRQAEPRNRSNGHRVDPADVIELLLHGHLGQNLSTRVSSNSAVHPWETIERTINRTAFIC